MFKKTFVAAICIILRLLHHGVAAASSSDVHLKENNLAWPYTISRNLQHLVATRTCPDLRPQDCICEQRPYKFVFEYTGHACAQSSNFQPDKFTCTGKSVIADANRKGAYLVFSEKEKNNNNAGIVLFQGWVKTGNKFEFDNGGDKFPADMDVNIYSGDDKKFLLQSVRFHSSCSQNLFLNDSFGAVELFGFQYERNGLLETCQLNTLSPNAEEEVADCIDNNGEFYVKLLDKMRTCTWARKITQQWDLRCSILEEVKSNCCATCANPIVDESGFLPPHLFTCDGDAIPAGTFWIESLQQMRSCKWALFDADKKRFRCSIPEVSKYCCETCEDY